MSEQASGQTSEQTPEQTSERRRGRLSGVLPDPGTPRTLALATLVTTVGTGALISCSALYFTRIVGLSATQLGLGLTLAGVVGLFVGVPFGYLADLRGPRGVAAGLTALSGIATAAYALAHSFWAFLLAAVLFSVCERGSRTAIQAAVASAVPAEHLVRTRAYLRSVNNVGIAAGTGLAGIALQVDTRAAYLCVFALASVSRFACGGVLLRLPRAERGTGKAPTGPRLAVLRDRPYVVVTLINMVVMTHFALLDVALPLWIVRHTDAPRSMVSILVLVNTVSVVFFQVRLTTGIGDLPTAVRSFRHAGLALAGACVLFAASASGPVWASVLLLVLAGVAHVVGEMLQSAASWVFSFDLAPKDKQGQYQGLFQTGYGASLMIAPTILIALVIQWGVPGWFVLAGVFLASSLLMAPVITWARRSMTSAAPEPAAAPASEPALS